MDFVSPGRKYSGMSPSNTLYMYNGDLSDRYVRLPENDVDLPENYADLFNKYMQIYLLVVINFFSDKSYQWSEKST